jgi:hypothetical protein
MDSLNSENVVYFFDIVSIYVKSIVTSASSETLVFGFTGLITLVFINYYLRMRRDTSRALKLLKKLRVILESATGKKNIKSAQDRDEAQQNLRKTKDEQAFIKSVEKADMFSLWEQINQNFTYEVNGNKVYTTTDFINSFLSFDKFITNYTSRGVISAPSVLTGLGIIGTFLGLSIGVGSASSGLASPDIAIARNAMSQLLEGAQLAFLTSLSGLFFALIMRLSFTARSEKIRIKIEDFNNFLSAVAIPKDSGISGLAALNNIQKNTQGISNNEVLASLRNIVGNTKDLSSNDNRFSNLEQKIDKLSHDLRKLNNE